MNSDDARRLALALPDALEAGHMGKPDFRVRNKIFASLPDADRLVVKLRPEQQAVMCEAEPAIFAPLAGGWGRQGWTAVALAAADETTLKSALLAGWGNVAPKRLLAARHSV